MSRHMLPDDALNRPIGPDERGVSPEVYADWGYRVYLALLRPLRQGRHHSQFSERLLRKGERELIKMPIGQRRWYRAGDWGPEIRGMRRYV